MSTGQRTMLRIVDNALQLGEDAGAGRVGREQEKKKESKLLGVLLSREWHRGSAVTGVVTRLCASLGDVCRDEMGTREHVYARSAGGPRF